MTTLHELHFTILGVQMLISCLYQECADEINNHFSQFITTPWRSPDVIVDIQLKTAERKLFRAIDLEQALDGVSIFTNKGKVEQWCYLSPLIPPYYLEPFRGRFVGLHAAAIDIKGKGVVVIAGDRTHGKTTTATRLVSLYDHCSLLADETVHIHRRSLAIEPFPTAMYTCKVEENGTVSKHAVKPETICRSITKQPASIGLFVFLDKKSVPTAACYQTVSAEECLQLLLKHHVDVGCNTEESLATLFYLANQVKAYKFTYAAYQDLLNFSTLLSQC